MTSAGTPTPTRQKLQAPLLLVLALGVMGYAMAIFALFLWLPNDHAGVFFGRQIVVEQVSPTSPLRPGDAILQIDGVDVNDALRQPGAWWQHMARHERGATYTVQRGDETLRLFVSWQPYTVLGLLQRGGALWIVGSSLAIIAAVLFTGHGHDTAARLIGLSFVTGALNQLNNVLPAAGANVALTWSWVFVPLDAIGVWLAISMMLHAMLLFPEVKAPARRYPRRLWLLHLITPALSLLVGFALGGPTPLGVRATLFDVTNPLLVLEIVLVVAALVHTYVTTRRPGVRNQIRWIIWGFGVALVPWLVFRVVPSMLFGTTWLPLSIANLSLILVPVTFLVSVFRFGLMDVDRLINRTLVYGLLGGALAILYFLILLAARDVLPLRAGQPNTLLAGVIATLVLFAVFNPLRMRAQRIVNQVFYREQLDFSQILREVGQALSTTVVLDEVTALLTDDIAARLGLAYAAVMLRQEDALDGAVYRDEQRRIAVHVDGELGDWLRRRRGPLVLYQQRRWPAFARAALRPLSAAQAEICLPLFQQNALLGLYVFGSKRSGNLFNRDEVNHLELLGHQAAAALQNARLYAELQEYNRSLEARVRARTAELQTERNRLDTIIQNVADGLVVTDGRGHVVLVNAAFAEIVRLPAEQVLGRPLAEVLPAEELIAVVERAYARPGEVFTVDIPGNEGRVRQTYKASACALIQRTIEQDPAAPEPPPETDAAHDAGAETLGVVTILRDITHEREVDRMKTELISMVSHELRTPLTSVLGFSKLIRKTFDRDIGPRIAEDDKRGTRAIQRVDDNLDIVINEGERLTRLINDVLDIAKMEAGKTEWHMEPVSIREILETSTNAIAALARQKGLPVPVEVEAQLPDVVADRDRIVQVVTNLLSNALKFTDEGQIAVRARRERVASREAGPPLPLGTWLHVSVQDTGIGIPEDKLDSVFEKFKQVSEAQSNRPKGTGLGLPICREIVEQHQGRIWVESVVGEGSTFHFVLPLEEQAAPAAAPAEAPASIEQPARAARPGCRVLVVEDEAAIRALLRQELGDAGYIVIEAADGMEGVDRARTAQPDVILLDVMIPRLTGFDVISVLKGNPETAQIPIVILSGVEDRERGYRLGADGYLTKPVDSALLLKTLNEVLDQAPLCRVP